MQVRRTKKKIKYIEKKQERKEIMSEVVCVEAIKCPSSLGYEKYALVALAASFPLGKKIQLERSRRGNYHSVAI